MINLYFQKSILNDIDVIYVAQNIETEAPHIFHNFKESSHMESGSTTYSLESNDDDIFIREIFNHLSKEKENAFFEKTMLAISKDEKIYLFLYDADNHGSTIENKLGIVTDCTKSLCELIDFSPFVSVIPKNIGETIKRDSDSFFIHKEYTLFTFSLKPFRELFETIYTSDIRVESLNMDFLDFIQSMNKMDTYSYCLFYLYILQQFNFEKSCITVSSNAEPVNTGKYLIRNNYNVHGIINRLLLKER